MNHIDTAVSNDTLFTIQKSKTGFAQYALQTNKLPVVSLSFLSSLAIAPGVVYQLLSVTVEIDVKSMAPMMSRTVIMISKELSASNHAQYMTIAIPVWTRENAVTIARSPKQRHLKTATDFGSSRLGSGHVDVRKAANLLYLSPEAVVAQKTLLQAVKTVSSVYRDNVWKIHEKHECKGGEDLGDNVDLLLRVPQYNVCCQQCFQNGNHDVLNGKDKKAFCTFAEYVLKCGWGGHIFCSVPYFAFWWLCLWYCTGTVGDSVEKMKVFELEQMLLWYSPEQVNYLQDPRLKRLAHTSLAIKAIDISHTIPLFNSVFARVCYNVPENMKSTHR